MSLRPTELTLLAGELNRELVGGVIQKVHAPTTTRLYAEVRVPGRSVTLLFCTDPQAARLSAVDERPSNPATPPTWQSVLRRELVGAKLRAIEALPPRRTLLVHLTRDQTIQRTLVLEVTSAPALSLLTEHSRVLCVSLPARPGLRVGAQWTLLDEQPVKDQPSRLVPSHSEGARLEPVPLERSPETRPSTRFGVNGVARSNQDNNTEVRVGAQSFLPLAYAAEALLVATEQRSWEDARRAPLLAKVKRLARTIEKVRVEADRTERAQALRHEGELLTQNLWQLKRGVPTVTVPEYLADGTVREVVIALDPKRTPAQEVEWRFHQYKRLLRGAEVAQARLCQLEAEALALRETLSGLEAAPTAMPAPAERGKKGRAAQQTPLPAYREYRGHAGQRIWVGRGSTHNDTLTFRVAKPFHVWFHARGVPGAHVVVPLEKNQSLAAEALLDAAHLALHHSDAKGEPRAEVSYTQVKFVRRGQAPGAVTFTREKTINLRVEPERLKRLLASVDDGSGGVPPSPLIGA
jgi:predicted ribosome quality control (RQC) complex YloA/Tae2 family protein